MECSGISVILEFWRVRRVYPNLWFMDVEDFLVGK